ncbi:tetratricopeptide repeat protein [Clostridiales bacterium oral taxon 876 str. F0540]|nr:tetratricopeptide repeat protein [Clostridiales bacterium oral taxon 876 str. F0540]
MEGKVYFSQRLDEVLFLDIKKEKLVDLFKIYLKEDVYMPIKSAQIIDSIKGGNTMEDIPLSFFIEGMFYVIGIDESFRYKDIYIEMLSNVPNSISFIKSLIFSEVKNEKYEDAYIFLKGLSYLEANVENYEKLFSLAENIRIKDKSFKEEELSIIERAKLIEDFAAPFLYESIIKREDGDFETAMYLLNTYISKGGEQTPVISEFHHSLKNIVDFERGKELLYEDPDSALKFLIPLLDEYGNDATLHYNIAVGYRILENYEKAIYYLNEALTIDDALVEVVNELGINYASLGDFDTAIKYLRKAFEATKSVEICTNLIMCYLNSGNVTQAKNHFDIAKKLDSNDEVVRELEQVFNKISL